MNPSRSTSVPRPPGEVEAAFQRYVTSSDRAALEVTMSNVAPELRRIARYYVKRPDLTEDLVQATILTAIERASTFDPERRLVPWMTGILLNKIASHRRDLRRREVDVERDERVVRSPLARAEAAEVQVLVSEALEQLPPRYREVLDLYLRQGKAGGEIATELARPPGTIRAQIHRGLRRLRHLLPPSLALGTLFGLRRPAHALERSRPAGAGTAAGAAGLTLGWKVLIAVTCVGVVAFFLVDRFEGIRRFDAPASAALAAMPRDDTGDDPLNRPLETARARHASASVELASRAAPAAGLQLVTLDRIASEVLPEALVATSLVFSDGSRRIMEERSDANGQIALELDPEDLQRVSVHAEVPGYVPVECAWDRSNASFQRGDTLLVPLVPARPIGGTVTDVEGRPIEGAVVCLPVGLLTNGERWSLSHSDLRTTTDAQGRWRLDSAPEVPLHLKLRAYHPDYAPQLEYSSERSPAPDRLWALEARMVLEPGHPFELRVHGPRGEVPEDVEIELIPAHEPPSAISDYALPADGTAHLTLPDGACMIRVAAPGYVQQIERLSGGRTRELDVLLPLARELEVTLLDTKGRPVHDAQARRFGSTWTEASQTDAHGRFRVPVNPVGRLFLEVRRGSAVGSVRVPVDLTTGIARLPTPGRTRVHVLDAATGRPIEEHQLRVTTPSGRLLGERLVVGAEPEVVEFHPPTGDGGEVVLIEASALGYRTALSAPLLVEEEPYDVELALTRVPVLELDITSQDGQPVSFLEIAFGTPEDPARVRTGALFSARDHRKVQSATGRVSINRPDGPFTLVIAAREGFAMLRDVDLAASTTIVLVPRGCVRGHTSSSSREPIELSWIGGSAPHLQGSFRTYPNAEGEFHLCSLPAGEYRVSKGGPGSLVVRVEPGGTTRFEL